MRVSTPLRHRGPAFTTYPHLGAIAVLLSLSGASTVSAQAPTAPVSTAGAPYGADAAPLFADAAPLEIRIESDFGQIRRDRGDENPEHEGRVYVLEADGTETEWPVQIRTRGNFRLQSSTCDFPPIRLNFPKSEVEGGVFEGQDKIKLVTHCRDAFERNVPREYLAYRLYNLVTEHSFRVRLARVTYIDTSGRHDPMTRLAFFIEMEEALAERLAGRVIPDEELEEGVHPARVLGPDAIRVDLFAFMVGNTDYSMYFPSDNGGLHNIVSLEFDAGNVVPVPYDFDMTGLVDARYAEPNPVLDIRDVTDRVFRGMCRPGLDYAAAYRVYIERKPAMEALVDGMDQMDDGDRRTARRFLDEFWDVIENQGRASRAIEGACRPI